MAVSQSSTDYPNWRYHWNFLNTEERIKLSCFWGTVWTLTLITYGAFCQSIAFNILTIAADVEECVNDTFFQLYTKLFAGMERVEKYAEELGQ